MQDVPEWHTAEDEKEENAGEGELFEFGQECLDRISFALGGKTLVPVAGTTLTAYMADTGSWEKRHAALICLAQIAEGCVKVMVDEVEKLVALCLLGARDGTPKVRWAACQALGQLCTDLGPDLQVWRGGEEVIGGLRELCALCLGWQGWGRWRQGQARIGQARGPWVGTTCCWMSRRDAGVS